MNKRNRYRDFDLGDLPPNYSGQYKIEDGEIISGMRPISNINNGNDTIIPAAKIPEQKEEPLHKNNTRENKQEGNPEQKKPSSGGLLSGIFGKKNDSEKPGGFGGLLSGLFNRDGGKGGGFLSGLELEDLILLGVIFFLLRDGAEDDMLIILALLLFSS